MDVPTVETLAIIAGDLGMTLPPERLRAAATAHAKLRRQLDELRALEMPYLDAIEPPLRLTWIARGGRS